MERTTRLLYGMAAILMLVGLALRLAPTPLAGSSQSGARGAQSGLDSGRTTRPSPGADTTVIGRNLFSSFRIPPRVRYTPPDLAPNREPARRTSRPASPGLRLFGTVSGTAALIDANPAIPSAELYQVGDVVRGKRIVAVAESTVVLDGPEGRTVLRLQNSQQPTR